MLEWFDSMSNQRGFSKCVCATVSFGVGLDFKSVRAVYCTSMPSSISELLQKIGRAGRTNNEIKKTSFAFIWYNDDEYSHFRSMMDKKLIDVNAFRYLVKEPDVEEETWEQIKAIHDRLPKNKSRKVMTIRQVQEFYAKAVDWGFMKKEKQNDKVMFNVFRNSALLKNYTSYLVLLYAKPGMTTTRS